MNSTIPATNSPAKARKLKDGLVCLSALTDQINEAHTHCLQSANQALDAALQCGELLQQAKLLCEHGTWQNWLSENFVGSNRTARLYLRLYSHHEEIEAKRQRVAVLGVREAVELIASRRSTRLYPPESDDWGWSLTDPDKYREMELRHAVFLDNTKVWWEEQSRQLDNIDFIDLGGANRLLKELTEVQSGWARSNLKLESAIGSILSDWASTYGEGFVRAVSGLIAQPGGIETFIGLCNKRLADLGGEL